MLECSCSELVFSGESTFVRTQMMYSSWMKPIGLKADVTNIYKVVKSDWFEWLLCELLVRKCTSRFT
jgi:hypothetical protein